MRSRAMSAGTMVVVTLMAVALLLCGCTAPPPLTKAELDSGKMPKKHPTLTAEMRKAGCRKCHREQAPVKNP